MRVVVFDGGRLDPHVVPAIEAQGYDPEVVDCADDPTLFPLALRHRFSSGEDFATVEHDVVAPFGSLAMLEHCPDPWCYHGYAINGRDWDTITTDGGMAGWFAPLGLTRFRPEPLREILRPVLEDPRFTETWVSRDTLISRTLADAGLGPHRHRPDAEHLHPYGSPPSG